ncbi:hypothetical protein K1719_039914 [Acacia pycnantha]|nr:hypothetical protein K1719_039914 [Acacia pycnantha]
MTKQDGTMHKLKTKMTIKDYDLILHKSTLKMLNESEKANICEDFDKRGNGHDDLEEGPPQSTSFNGELIHSDRGAWLNPWVIDIFVEILTESEKKKATPSNWYLPVMFM